MINLNWKGATPTQLNLWGILSTYLVTPITVIVPLHYQGPLAGSEFLNYAADKFYFILKMQLIPEVVTPAVAAKTMTFYDKNNNQQFKISHDISIWDTTAAAWKYKPTAFTIENIYFSRVAHTVDGNLIFDGYRLTY